MNDSTERAEPAPAAGHRAVLPAGWPRPKGYANGVVAQGRQPADRLDDEPIDVPDDLSSLPPTRGDDDTDRK